ncbi:LLM class flavin-dependent oxidoreductase [Microlunatus sp. GCM10028923]|uniref:LLM class flavin-dependent oxidoreductase n=1 Tax=Microlunatus sp. GCM10028923 TaxID=3273400 RepID=UPI003618F801
MRFAVSMPQVATGASFDPDRLRDYLAEAEELGFESAWTGEQVIGTLPMLSPLEVLSFAAACTRRLRLGCAMFVSSLHNPVHLAKAIASLDQLSRGRTEIGLVAGGARRNFSAFGVEPASFVARFTEGIRLMQRLWSEPRVDFDGRFWQLPEVALEPKPVQRPHPPIWLGGSHPNALRRAVRLGQGFLGAGSSTTAQFAAQAATIRTELNRHQRDSSSFTLAKRVYLAVDDNPATARARAAEALHRRYDYFGMGDLTSVAITGTVDDCASGLGEVVSAGAQLIVVDLLLDDPGQLRRLASEVIPRAGYGVGQPASGCSRRQA